jgi:hypothetical protein
LELNGLDAENSAEQGDIGHMIPNKATLWLKWDFHISQVSHPKNVIKYSYQKGNGT